MDDKKRTHSLSVFLIKEGFTKHTQIIKAESCEVVDIHIAGHGKGRLYIRRIHNVEPKWVSLFAAATHDLEIKTEGVGAAFLIRIDERFFALTFGQSGRFLLQDDVCEDRFGLLVTLNAVDEQSIRCVDKQSLDSIESHSRIQSGQQTSADAFGLDIEQDMLKALVGRPREITLGTSMTGNDSLSVNVHLDLIDLPELLRSYRKHFEADLTATKYGWVNNIAEIKPRSTSLIAALEEALIKNLACKEPQDAWLAIPEIIDWTHVKGFTYSNDNQGVHPDVTWRAFFETFDKEALSIELLKRRRVYCADADHKRVYKDWAVFKCLYAEVDLDGSKYILNDGKWFQVNKDFVQKTNEDYAKIPLSPLDLPNYTEGGEGAYNKAVANLYPDKFALLDADAVIHGGSKGKIEFCDLFSIDKRLIHVKRYGKSSVLSHLLAQGLVSAQLLHTDADFRKKVRAKLGKGYAELIPERRPDEGDFTVTYAVISDADGIGLHLPFFSRVNINNTAAVLKGFGYKVEVLKISVDPNYGKKTTYPPSKMKS